MLKVMSFWQSFSKKTMLVLASSSKILGVIFMCVGWILSFSCSRNLLGGVSSRWLQLEVHRWIRFSDRMLSSSINESMNIGLSGFTPLSIK